MSGSPSSGDQPGGNSLSSGRAPRLVPDLELEPVALEPVAFEPVRLVPDLELEPVAFEPVRLVPDLELPSTTQPPRIDTHQISELASAGASSESFDADEQGSAGVDEPFVATQVTHEVESGEFGDFVSDIIGAEINEAAADALWDDLG